MSSKNQDPRNKKQSPKSTMEKRNGEFGLATLLVLGVMVGTAPAGEPTNDKVERIKNVSYYDGADRDAYNHRLDIYLPKGVTNFPTVVFFHGGTWSMGSKDGFLALPGHKAYDHGNFFAERGIAAVFCNYRLSPKVQHPEHTIDAARAFAWVRRNIAGFGGDADRMFVMGHSAGGHISSLLASDPKYLMAEGLTPSMIRGVISVSGVYILAGDLHNAGNDDAPIKGVGSFLTRVFGTDPVEHRKASPIAHVHPDMPPFLVAYARGDIFTLPAQAVAFAGELEANGNAVHKLQVDGRSHQSILKNTLQQDDPLGTAILDFIRTGKP